MESKTFKVPNIGCDGCVRTIVNELSQQPGVQTVSADKDTQIVTVKWQQPASWASIDAALTAIDYPPALETA
jgi:copper chaperone CopZ